MNLINNIINDFTSIIISNGPSIFNENRIRTNANCAICIKSGRPPNMLGRFIKVNDTHQKCNGCNTIISKDQIFRQIDMVL